MNKLNFSLKAGIELQGEETLEYLGTSNPIPCYKVIGFEQEVIILQDFRHNSQDAINTYLRTRNAEKFLGYFCSPSQIHLKSDDTTCTIEIYDNVSSEAENYTLWIAIGMGKSLPAFDYLFYHAVPLGEEIFAMVSVYQHPESQNPVSSLPCSNQTTSHVEMA